MADLPSPIPIAIIGMGCRFPGGANSPEELWDMLSKGQTGWTDVPPDRYNWKSFYHPDPEARGAHNSRGGHFINQDISEFDPHFFGVTSEEANSLDPQQRLLLMTAYEALENASIPIESIRGSDTSVYVAVVSRDYDRMIYKDPSDIPKYHLTGCGDATACGRISYTFDFRGPSVTLDTGCSGSMVGLHQACQGLRLGESSMSLVCGTNLLLGPDMTIAMSMLHMLNDDGRCYSFDSRGSGYGRSEGVATIVLKRLDDALIAGDPIRAIIRNTGVNQDGKTNGILLPNSESQQDLMRSMYGAIQLDPGTVGYVEAHGTGTAAGDATEMNSISKAFCKAGHRTTPLYVGSVKANIGHLESASGLAGIIKTVLAMEKGFIPPVPNIVNLKDNLHLENNNIKIPRELEPWSNDVVRHASINSFGFGGTNAHVILESVLSNQVNSSSGAHKTSRSNGIDGELQLVVVSAKSKRSLVQSIKNLEDWISSRRTGEFSFLNLAYTLSSRRSALSWRSSFVASSSDELLERVTTVRLTKSSTNFRIAFLFTGQGAQWFAMGRELLGSSSSFGKSLCRADSILTSIGAKWSLLEELQRDETATRLNEGRFSQPVTTAIQIGLVDLIRSLSVKPDSVLGHSSGEIAAAYACGILSQESAIKIAYHRSFVSSWCREDLKVKGAMLAVGVGESDISTYISRSTCAVACQNSPVSTTISGDEAAIDELKEKLDREGIFNRKLKVDTAYHSYHMKAIAEKYRRSLGAIKSDDPDSSIRFFSSVTGEQKTSGFGTSYWVENLVSKVRFSDAFQCLATLDKTIMQIFIEIGPHAALQGPVRQSVTHLSLESSKCTYLASFLRGQDARRSILDLAGKLFEQGCRVNLELANSLGSDTSLPPRDVIRDLPQYPWDLSKHWHESRLSRDYRFRSHPYHDLLGLRLIGSTELEPSWRNLLSVDSLPWLHEHIIDNFALFPGSGFLCMAIEAARQISQDRGWTMNKSISEFVLRDISFSKALVIPDSPAKVEVLLSLRPSNSVAEKATISSQDFCVTSLGQDGTWNENCHGTITIKFAPSPIDKETIREDEISTLVAVERLEAMKVKCTESLNAVDFYEELRSNGINYGKTFSTIQNLHIGECQAVATVAIPDVAACMPSRFLQPHVIHPATFDALMHIALPLYRRHCSPGPAMLISIDEVIVSANIANSPGDELILACDLTPTGPFSGSVDVSVFHPDDNYKTKPKVTLAGQKFRGIGDSQTTDENWAFARDLTFQTEFVDIFNPAIQDECPFPVTVVYEQTSVVQTQLAKAFALGNPLTSVSAWPLDQINDECIYLILEDSSKQLVDDRLEFRPQQVATVLSKGKFVLLVRISIDTEENFTSLESLYSFQTRRSGQRFVTFEVRGPVSDQIHLVNMILKATCHSFCSPDSENNYEREYFFHKGQVKVPRFMQATKFSQWATKVAGKPPAETGLFHNPERPLRLEMKTPGLLDSLVFVDDEAAQAPLGSDELEIDVQAHAVNQKDVVIATGRLSSQTPMVGECAGIITGIGSEVSSKFKIGDRVCGWGGTSYRSKCRINHLLVHHLPSSFSFSDSASIPYVFQTAYHALVQIADLQRGQTILIHSAMSGVGLAAIAIAQHLGATIFTTIGSESLSERKDLVEDFNVAAERIFSSNSDAFRRGILRLTHGEGVDAILNTLQGERLADTWACIAEFGTFVDISMSKEARLSLQAMEKNITYASVDMALLSKRRPKKIQTLFSKVMSMFCDGSLKLAHPITTMPMSDIVDAFRLLHTRKHRGKVVLVANEKTTVNLIPSKPSPLKLDRNITYIIAGEDNSLVQVILKFMVSHGASNVVWLTRQVFNTEQEEAFFTAKSMVIDGKIKTCDIHNQEKVDMLASMFKDSGIVVGGIVQIGQKPLEQLLHAFINPHLEFSITISSLFQAISHQSTPQPTDQDTTQNFTSLSVSLDLSSIEHFSLILEYAMSAQARQDGYQQLVSGIDRKSIGSQNPSLLEDPLFSNLPVTVNEGTELQKNEKGVHEAESIHEAEDIISKLVAKKLASLVAIDEDDIELEMRVSEIGLDSLVAIEFKNWIGRNLSAPMQTSEILDAVSLRALSALIATRSSIVGHEQRAIRSKSDDNLQHQVTKKTSMVNTKPKLPVLPLPDMESSVQLYLTSIRPFCSDSEFAHTKDAVKELQKPGGIGRKLHGRLAKLANDPSVDCWLEDLYNSSCFLSRRVQLVPFSNFFFTHRLSPFPHSQAERAAIIAESVFQYQQILEADQLDVQYLNEQSVCTFLNQWLFNAARRPRLGTDTMHKFPGNDYLVTLSRGRVYKVALKEASRNVPYSSLKTTFEAISMETSDDTRFSWAGILTSDERNSWAKVRELIRSINDSNAEYLDVIEGASFLICLDDASPATAAERAYHFHFGDGSNRWNDKSLQFPVCRNGISGIIGDHSMLDAGTVFGLNAFVTKAILEHKPDPTDTLLNGTRDITLQEYQITTTAAIDSQIDLVQQDYKKNTSGVEHSFLTIEGCGEASMRAIKCSPKSAFQIIAMLASKNYFGCLEPCWESASLSNFHKGRVENNQGLLPPVAEFLTAVDNTEISLKDRRKMFFEAVKAHASSVQRATRGRGFDRYLTSLRQVLEEGEPLPDLFRDPVYARTRPRKFMSHTHETGMLEQAFLLRDPEAIWLHYVVEDNRVKWSMCGPTGRTKIFCELLEKATETVKTLLGLE